MTALNRAQKLTELESIQDQTIGRPVARERLAELLADEDVDIRAAAAGAVGIYTEDAALVDAALRLAAEDADPGVKLAAVTSLGQVFREGVLAGAEEADYAPETDLGEPVLETYSAVKQLLLDLLDGSAGSDALRKTTLLALSPLSHEERVVEAIEALRADDLPAALGCMGRGGDPRWATAVQDALEDDDQATLQTAIEAAGQVEALAAIPLLSRILKGARQPTALRVAAAAALGGLGGQNTATTLLEVAENESDEAVQSAARWALSDLTLLTTDREEP